MAVTVQEVTLSTFRDIVRARWPKLNADELDLIESEPEVLVDVVQEAYGLEQDEADRQVHEFEIKQRIPDFESRTRRRYLHA